MEKFEKIVSNYLEDNIPDSELKGKVMNKIKNAKRMEHIRHNVFLGLAIAIAFTFLLSFVVPVFGKSGTLPQLIKSIKIETQAKSFEGIIEIDSSVSEKITEANLPFADAVVISALSKDKNIDIDKVIELRKEGFGWGKILDTLNTTLSEKDLTGESASSGVSKATNTTNNLSVSQNEIEQNTNKNQNKNQGSTTSPQNKEKETETERNENDLIIVVKGTIKEVSENTLTIDNTAITLNENTSAKYLGKVIALTDLKVGDTVLVHAVKDGDTLFARDIILYKDTKGTEKEASQNKNTQEQSQEQNQEQNESQTTQNEEKNQQQNSQKEYEINTKIVNISNNMITLEDFANPVYIDDSTKIEQNGKGRVDISALEEGQKVQIHIRFDGTNYKATQIIIQTRPESKDNSENSKTNKPNENSKNSKKP
ncbi:DUF5666 domain-containing protein [Caldisericum exile]|uniref:DUF5666 domain-containing protein n=1 Tax=Caldisericum exile (strain DSM 21853 / NBRC 104410 / AZM16c01) TaxID=511051 RepID=A0A7U6GFF9_CALEA|nr:DUF5666 domain-containing protein [Caldisericum exile]BAL81356.1 hypothetical protein CSE_12300 [Caldisericum exile AZM16c01]